MTDGLAVLIALSAAVAGAADRDQLLFHAETLDGRAIQSQAPDTPFNPASLVKVGTSLWALDSLGPTHRYRTVFGIDGEWDKKNGRLVGSLPRMSNSWVNTSIPVCPDPETDW